MDLVCEQSIGVEREQRKSFGLLRCERGRLRMQPWLKYNWLVSAAPGERFQEERWYYEETDFGLANRRERRLNHPEFKASTYRPGVYENAYKHRAILVCLEACGADSPVYGTKFTSAGRTSSG
jgi:hypothetical protein